MGLSPYNIQVKGSFLKDLYFGVNPSLDTFNKVNFGTEYEIKNIWSDMGAQLYKDGVAPTRLETFWGKMSGPKLKAAPGKGSYFELLTAQVKADYDETVSAKAVAVQHVLANQPAAGSSNGSDSVVLQKQIKEMEAVERNKKMEEMRTKSKEILEAANKKKMVQIKVAKAKDDKTKKDGE